MRAARAEREAPASLPKIIETEARIVGLRDFNTLSLDAVEHRRIQLWILTSITLVCFSVGVVVLSIWPSSGWSAMSSGALRWGIVLLSIAFCVYAIDKERHLQKLSRLLTDERVLTAALSNRLRELSLLLQAGKAMNAALELDAVLDVDNYFRDPPNHQPPRARIYSRYASLLAYLRDRGYARIVIVSHSQGTVISADLLRYLHVQRRLAEIVGQVPIALVTVGSPLRDLYAEHFPLLYRWMGSNAAGFATAAPSASDIGAVEWVNACRSGDYVGRFLWTPPGHAYRIALVGPDGQVEGDRVGDRTEFCLGAGAHTHYFSNDAVALTVEIDRLIEG